MLGSGSFGVALTVAQVAPSLVRGVELKCNDISVCFCVCEREREKEADRKSCEKKQIS